MQIKLDDNVPLPAKNLEFPWSKMKVGQSFFTTRSRSTVASAAYAWGRRHNMKFSTYAVQEDGVNGYRVWRVK